jgi:hypothetical protein
MEIARVDVVAAGHAATVETELRAVRVGVFHGVDVEVLVHIGFAFETLAIMPAAEPCALTGQAFFIQPR